MIGLWTFAFRVSFVASYVTLSLADRGAAEAWAFPFAVAVLGVLVYDFITDVRRGHGNT
jgi:hypothetical protein